MRIPFIHTEAQYQRKKTEQRLESYNQPTFGYFFLIFLSSTMATFGLIMNNTSIVIGAMVVAPLITPFFGLSLSLLLLHGVNILKSIYMLFAGTVLAILTAMFFATIINFADSNLISLNTEIISRTKPDVLFFLVALFSGMAGAYAYAKPDKLDSLAGAAISVAVIPPLSVTGIGLTISDSLIFSQSLFLYLFNLSGICFGAILVFFFLGFGGPENKLVGK